MKYRTRAFPTLENARLAWAGPIAQKSSAPHPSVHGAACGAGDADGAAADGRAFPGRGRSGHGAAGGRSGIAGVFRHAERRSGVLGDEGDQADGGVGQVDQHPEARDGFQRIVKCHDGRSQAFAGVCVCHACAEEERAAADPGGAVEEGHDAAGRGRGRRHRDVVQ